ncbi:MAG: hypothetical protein AAFX00_13105 [Pseudomonadota bacterium]
MKRVPAIATPIEDMRWLLRDLRVFRSLFVAQTVMAGDVVFAFRDLIDAFIGMICKGREKSATLEVASMTSPVVILVEAISRQWFHGTLRGASLLIGIVIALYAGAITRLLYTSVSFSI